MNRAEELLGMMVDLSAKQQYYVRGIDRGRVKSGSSNTRWVCMFCNDFAETPPQIKHIHMCIVAQARDYLADENKGITK
jgi:hypothetical protein